MKALVRAEFLKQRSIPTGRGLVAGMAALIGFAVLLHGLSLPADHLESRQDQLEFVFRWGALFGTLFAALAGALSITGEFRHGTIRPTLLATPRRINVLGAKLASGLVLGAGFGALAALLGAGVATLTLVGRSYDVALDTGDYALLLAGGSVSAALWGALGVGVGALVRQPVPAIAGLAIWLLFIENLLVAFVPRAGRLAPGAAGAALGGIDTGTLLAPAAGGALLAVYAVAVSGAAALAFTRRDVP